MVSGINLPVPQMDVNESNISAITLPVIKEVWTGETDKYLIENQEYYKFHRVLTIALFFGLLPIRTVFSPDGLQIRFDWISWRVFYCILISCVYLYKIISFFVSEEKMPAKLPFSDIVPTISLFATLISYIYIASKWEQMTHIWTQVHKIISKYKMNNKWKPFERIKILAAVDLCMVISWVVLLHLSLLRIIDLRCPIAANFWETLQLYAFWFEKNVFIFIPYKRSTMMLVIIFSTVWKEVVFLISTWIYEFVALTLASYFGIINDDIKFSKWHSYYWRSRREDYNKVAELTKFVSDMFAVSLFFILTQKLALMITIYLMFWSVDDTTGILLLITGIITMSQIITTILIVSTVYNESITGQPVLFTLPSHLWNNEIKRWMDQLIHEEQVLSIGDYLYIKRHIVCVVCGATLSLFTLMFGTMLKNQPFMSDLKNTTNTSCNFDFEADSSTWGNMTF